MSNCNLSGPIEDSLQKLKNLSIIHLNRNNLFGPLPKFFAEFQNLTSLHLGDNNLSGMEVYQKKSSRHRSCRLLICLSTTCSKSLLVGDTNFGGRLPESIGNLRQLTRIELTNCKFNGPLPKTLEKLTQLVYLDFSTNNFSGPVPSFTALKALTYLNLAHNQFNGSILSTNWSSLLNLVSLDLARNSFSGTVPPTLFRSQSLRRIYLPQNQFTGGFSEVKGEFSSLLEAIDLSRNKLQGEFPMFVFEIQGPRDLSLSCNKFSGLITLSAFHKLKNLSVLDLSYNNLSFDSSFINLSLPPFLPNIAILKLSSCNLTKFPDFLKNLSILYHLDLSNNRIHGQIPSWIWKTQYLSHLNLSLNFLVEFERTSHRTSPLLIIDLASNSFGGKLPQGLLMTWNAMMTEKDEPYSEILHFPILKLSELSFQDSMTVTMKGIELELVKILTIFTSIDFSSNKFEGPIPEAIGDFRALYLLNLSNNALTGTVPSFLGNLLKLEALDLSSNHLIGHIPLQLANLNFLSFLNLSNNELIGKIPLGTQIQSFPEASFENNAGLCGPPLKAPCESPPVTKVGPPNPRTGNHINWNLISVEIGFVFGLGAVIVPLMFWKRWRIWYSNRIDRVLFKFFPKLDHRNRNHRTIAQWIQGRRLL
ncbi:hypothetical protein GOBAR_DD05229 [Gossypium barbadense]|nr:hypothetical protein GOBAR_DD05229 [Gossypium barbadense]